MGFFNKKTPEQKMQEIFQKYGLDIEKYDDKQIQEENTKNLKQISMDLAGSAWFKAGLALSFASGDKQATIGYLSAIFNQNLIVIRQNELLIRLLKKIAEK